MSAPSAAEVDAARLLLARLGVSPADLLAATEDRAPAPTFAEYIPVGRAAVTDGTRRVYESYWNRIVEHQLLRYRTGHPITARRYDHLWTRIGNHLPWVATQQVTTHWLRHTTFTWVERNFGYAVARAYAGHTGNNNAGTTTTYITATLHEVATALTTLTNEPHPLAEPIPIGNYGSQECPSNQVKRGAANPHGDR